MFFTTYGFENITPQELCEKMASEEDLFLLDVRTPMENAAQAIEGSHLIPIQELGSRTHELPRDKEIVIYCRIGNRSAWACAYLARLGYTVRNLEGGIALWNRTAGAAMARVSS